MCSHFHFISNNQRGHSLVNATTNPRRIDLILTYFFPKLVTKLRPMFCENYEQN